MTVDAVLFALLIFALRVINNAMATVRVVLITRQRRFFASILGFIEALIFALVIANVINDLNNWLNLTAYCAGFAAGNYMGMALEQRFITSYTTLNIIAATQGHEIALMLRDEGHGVTETIGEGRDGQVTMLRSVVISREVPALVNAVRDRYPDVFISLEETRPIQHVWLRNGGHKR